MFNINERKHIIINTHSPEPFQYEIRLIGTDGEQTLSYTTCRGEIETIEYVLYKNLFFQLWGI